MPLHGHLQTRQLCKPHVENKIMSLQNQLYLVFALMDFMESSMSLQWSNDLYTTIINSLPTLWHILEFLQAQAVLTHPVFKIVRAEK